MRRSLLLIATLLLPLLFACSTDDDTVEGKACVPGSSNPAEQCVTGYKCIPYPEGAKCEAVKSSSLQLRDDPLQIPAPARLHPDLPHNRALLRRLGLEL